MTFIKRADLGRPLTWDEMDSNWEQVDSYAAAASAAASAAQTQAQSSSQSASQALQYQQAAEAAAASAASAVDVLRQDLAGQGGAEITGTMSGKTVQEELNNNSVNDRELWRRSLAEAGLTLVDGSFEEGATANSKTDVVWHVAGGQCYTWDGAFQNIVPPGSTPESAGGVGPGKWVGVGDAALRSGLAKLDGVSLIGGATYAEIRAYGGTANRINCLGRQNIFDHAHGDFVLDTTDTTSADNDGTVLVDALGRRWKRNYIIVDMRWFGIVGGGIVDNATAFQQADALGKNLFIDGSDTYLTTYEPVSRVYTNAAAKMKIGGVTITLSQVPLQITAIEQAEFDDTKVRLSNTLVGIDVAPNLLSNANSYGNTAYGTGAMQNAVEAKRVTAIGPFAVRDPIIAYSVTGIGTTALEWMVYGDRLTFVGDNSGKNLGNPTPVGRHAYFDPDNPNPNNWDTRWPAWRTYAGAVNSPAQVMTSADFGNKATHMVGIGRNAFGFSLTAKDSVALGYDAGTSVLYGQDNVFIGDRVGQWTIKANFTVVVGSKAMRSLMDSDQDTVVGNSAMSNYVHASRNVAMGYQALAGFQCNLADTPLSNIAIGRISMANCVGNVSYNVAVGEGTLSACRSNENTALGTSALGNLADAAKGRNTAVGRSALLTMQDGSNATSILQCTGIGWGARVSGDDQIQLGGSTSTTYVYGTVQNRSDARDKTDIRDTTLGIDFIMGLRPVDGRLDMRDDYIEHYEEQVGIDPDTAEPILETRTRILEKDGSKKRERFHHWFIAQEVKELCDKLGVEFGGYQDHSVNGGCDVLSLGYDEFIPPTVRAVQQCWERMDAQGELIAKQAKTIATLEERLAKLEKLLSENNN